MKFLTVLCFVFGIISLFIGVASTVVRVKYESNKIRQLIDSVDGVSRHWPYETKAYFVFLVCACYLTSQFI